ncbi:Internalin-A precursor [Anaerostipes hadrus]|uniref:Internalin-A n=1 Tax=Anaerostipes hadrus TaxID=649756 RepID=A0A173UWV8_ANAHA|nr:InlB B-repeat-containing protein [Anaerostipes hadrus]CUN18567.1 Internalin-A precursor [Anaerostipes hadrus]
MFDKIQSTYFKRVTTGVLALFMTASSGFSYAVPVYAEEVTTAAAKRKKEEEFSSTESSTLQLNENSTKEEVVENKEDKSSNTTEKTLTTKTTEVSDEKVQNESQRSDEDIQKEKQEMKSNFKVADIDYSSLKKSEYAKDKLEYDDKSLQKLFDYKIEIEQISFDDALKSVENYIANNEFDFHEFLCKISQNDPYKLFYSLSDADREKVLKQCNENEQYALKYLLMYSGLDFIQQNQKNNENKTFYVESLSKYFDNFKKFNKDNNLGEDVHDFDMLMDNFFQMRKENYRKNIVYLIESHSELINKIINILNDSSKWNKSGINEIEKICNNKFQVKQNSGILKEKAKVSYTKGGFYLAKKAGSTQRTNVTLTRNNAPAWSNFTSTAYTYNISRNNSTLIPNGWIETKNSTPVYSSNKVKARKDQKTGFTVLYFRVTYTQPAHYKKDQADHDKANCDNAGRMNFFKYSAANDSTENTFMDDLVHANTDRAVNYQINMMQCGLRDDAEGGHHGHAATEGKDPSFGSTLKYEKPTHTVTFKNGYGGTITTSTVSDGNNMTLPADPTRDGYRFTGWSGDTSSAVCSNRTITAKWQKQYRLDINGRLNGGSIQSNTNGMGTFDVFVNGTQTRWSDRDAWDMIDDGATVEIKNIKADSGIHYSGNSTISFTMNGDKTDGNAIILDFTSGSTLSIDPNGGTYKGSSGVTTVNRLSPGATITVDSPTRPGYKFGGYEKSNESYQSYASNTGWTTSHGENVGTYSRSYDGSITYNEAPDGGYYRTNHVWRGIDSATDNYNCISFPTYTAQAGHTYKISGEVWISERPSGGSFALNFYHGDSSNDWKHCMWGISEGWTGKWVKFSMERTFDTTTNDARFEIWTSNLKGLTGNISFWLQGLKITDETTGNDVSMTKIAMGDSDIKLTARWIPLHSTLSYDAQGGSLGSVKSTDNPNNYKIVDNGAYFIQSGLNTSRYLHQRTNGQLNLDNATDVLTWNGYSSDSKQTLWTFERYKNTPYYYIINNFNGKALDLSGDGPDDLSGKPVELWKQCDANNKDNSDFLWYFKDTGDGYVNIYNKMTNKALDITNGEDADGVVLQQYAPNGTASQKFKLVNYSQVYFPTREKYANNNIYINSATPVKKGCKFLGWSTSANGNVVYQPGDLYDVNQDGGNVTLYAKWEKAKYTATVKLNGGSYNGSTKDFTISKYPGEEISIGAPTRSKHNFAGYKLTMDNNDGDAPTSVTQSASGFKGIMQMGNFTLNAQWTPWKHTVRYDANAKNDTSVKGIPASQSKTANVDITLSSDVPTRNGYTFLGWNTQADGNGTAYAAGATYTHDQDGGTVTLYAQWTPWKHVLHYNKNVPTSSTSQTVSNMPVDQTKTFGQLMTISNLVPTRKGYTFAGWYTQSNGTGTKYDPGSNYAADQNGGTVNLYAKWTPWTYNIKYDQNVKSTSSSKTVTDMPAAQTKTQEIDVTLSSMTPKRNGYIFAGWSTSANGSVEYKPGSRFTKDLDSNGASITLYAVWTPWKHTIHYNSNIPTNAPTGTTTVSNMPGDQTKTFDEKLMISSNKPTRKGYNFAGWSTSANGNVVYQPGAEYKNDQNGGTVTLYAKWTAWKHTVTYDKNVPANSKKTDVKNMPGNQTKIYDQNLTLQSNVPTRIGYTFVKWTTNKDGTGTAYQPGSQYSYNRDSDGGTVTLYAVWTPWKYTVRYDKNVPANSSSQTVSNMPADQTKTEEVNLTLSSNKPSRNGYIFNGWQAQINGKAVDYQPGATLSYDPDVKGSVITLKAKWTAWKHTIHYDKNVPASSSSQTVANMPEDDTKTFDITKTISSTKPSRNGYIFNGWNTQKDGKGTAYASGAAYKHDQNGGTVTLYAQWTPWKHTVTYDKNVDPSSSSQTVTNMPGNQTKTFDEKLMISSTKPSRNGYIFNGWNTQKNGKGTAYASGAEYKHDQNGNTVTLYAQWTAWKHTVHYNANGGDQNSVPTDQTKTFDQAMILSDKKPTRHGYNFVRWNTKADGTGTSYEAKGNYNHDQNGGTVTLYAIWTPWVHTVHYDANGGDQSSVPNDQKKTYGQSMNVATKVPTRNEYKFLGWTTGKDGSGTFYNPGDAYYHDQNGQTVTLYAKWIQLYTVKYDGSQPAIKGVTVTGSVANQTQGQDESVNLRTNNFKNDSGVYKDWSVGKDAYKYKVRTGSTEYNQYIHPEGFKTNHSAMQNELRGYRRLEDTMIQN